MQLLHMPPMDRLEFLLTRYDIPTSNIPLGEWKTLVAAQKKAIDQNNIAEYALDFALASRSGEGAWDHFEQALGNENLRPTFEA
jgi:hypothetical protein